MSAVRFWPYPVTAVMTSAVAGLLWALAVVVRLRGDVVAHWPPAVAVLLAVAGAAGAVAYRSRPAFLSAPAAPQRAGTVEEVEGYIERLLTSSDPPGLSAVVIKDGEVVYARGFGYADGPHRAPATPDTVYRWWSVTKLFTAVAVLRLQEQGRLDVDAPVGLYLPFFDVVPPSAARGAGPVTVRHLLTHTSGLPDVGAEILGWVHLDGDPTVDQTELLKRHLPRFRNLVSPPGTEGRYTNLGYMVLAAVVEAASGQAFETYVTEHLLRPLGLSSTGFDYQPGLRVHEAAGSHPVDLMAVPASFALDLTRVVRERRHGRLWFERVHPDQTGPTGLLGSTRDLATFLAALLGNPTATGGRLLSPKSIEAMNRRHADIVRSPAPIQGAGFGFGWFRHDHDGRTALTHGGQGLGFVSIVRMYPEENLGIAVAANSTYLGRSFGLDLVDLFGSVGWTGRTADHGSGR